MKQIKFDGPETAIDTHGFSRCQYAVRFIGACPCGCGVRVGSMSYIDERVYNDPKLREAAMEMVRQSAIRTSIRLVEQPHTPSQFYNAKRMCAGVRTKPRRVNGRLRSRTEIKCARRERKRIAIRRIKGLLKCKRPTSSS